jgi:hypothetical protein
VREREHHKDDGSLERSSFASFARWIEEPFGRSTAFVLAILARRPVARHRPVFWLLEYLAPRRKYGHHDRNLSDGLRHPEHQNRDTKALQLKIDELKGLKGCAEFADEPGRKVRTRSRGKLVGVRDRVGKCLVYSFVRAAGNRRSLAVRLGRKGRRMGVGYLYRIEHLRPSFNR